MHKSGWGPATHTLSLTASSADPVGGAGQEAFRRDLHSRRTCPMALRLQHAVSSKGTMACVAQHRPRGSCTENTARLWPLSPTTSLSFAQ